MIVIVYLFFNDDTDFLDCAVKLVNVDFSLVVNIEEFKTFCKETLLTLVRWALLHKLGFHLSLETKEITVNGKIDIYFLMTLFIITSLNLLKKILFI